MKSLTAVLFSVVAFLGMLASSVVSFAQSVPDKVDVDINSNSGGGGWYGSPWIWIVGVALFIIIIVAITRGNNKDA